VQPARAASEPAELVRLVEELQERESPLRTELLEHKILKEIAAIVSFLETDLDAVVATARSGEKRVREVEGEMAEMRKRKPCPSDHRACSSKVAAAASPDGSDSGRARPAKDGMGGAARRGICPGRKRRRPEVEREVLP
jgi:hypothetical protein